MLVKGAGDFTPAPEGMHDAVAVDVIDMGLMYNPQFQKTQHKCRIVWETAAKMPDGRPFIVNQLYTAILSDRSTLLKHLQAWRGRPFTPQELAGFDLDAVIGKPCQLLVVHNVKQSSVFANVQAVLKARQEFQLKPSGQYVRVAQRPPQQQQGQQRPQQGQQPQQGYQQPQGQQQRPQQGYQAPAPQQPQGQQQSRVNWQQPQQQAPQQAPPPQQPAQTQQPPDFGQNPNDGWNDQGGYDSGEEIPF